LHFVVSSLNPREGGMAQTLARLGGQLDSGGRIRVVFYTRRMSQGTQPLDLVPNCQVVNLNGLTEGLLPCNLSKYGSVVSVPPGELALARVHVLRNAVSSEMRKHPGARHVLVSFYVIDSGILAQRVADVLQLPHVACVRGSDFAIYRCQLDRYSLYDYVCKKASWIVTTNHTQERRLREDHNRADRITTIFNSVHSDPVLWWEHQPKDHIQVVADCCYSSRKGTHLLLEAVRQLRGGGIDIRLSLVGELDFRPPGPVYWAELRRKYSEADPGGFALGDYLAPSELAAFLLAGDIYCSPSLCEGSSNAMNRAMALGIPIVATRTGSHAEMIGGASHVTLCVPGDLQGLVQALGRMAALLRERRLEVDREAVRRWRRQLSPSSEQATWHTVLEQVLGSRLDEPYCLATTTARI
jgi:glycosyltransferase involved in cell wall biosynthesis